MARGRGTAKHDELPDVDERLVMPESGIEILDGKVLSVPGADPPHARHHAQLAYLLQAHVAPGFAAVVDMLTRTSAVSDFAPDASIYPEGPDTRTGGRRLEVVAFEIVSAQRLSVPTKKARELSRRGVGRVFALVLGRKRALEWDRRVGRFRPMHPDECIDDACLAVPLPIAALLDSVRADDAVLAAIEVRRPDLVARIEKKAEARAEARGEARGRAQALRAAAAALGVSVPARADAALDTKTTDELDELIARLVRARAWPGER